MNNKKKYTKTMFVSIAIVLFIGILGVISFELYRKNSVLYEPYIQEEEAGTFSQDYGEIIPTDPEYFFDNNSSNLIVNTTSPTTASPTTTELVSENNETTENTTKPIPQLPNNPIDDDEKLLLSSINSYRKDNNLPELTIDKTLSDFANLRARELQTAWSYSRPDGKPFNSIFKDYEIYTQYNAKENVASFKEFNTNAIINAWNNSEIHKNVLLNKEYNSIGIGITYDSNGKCYISAIFIKK